MEEGGRHFIDGKLVLFMFWYDCIKYKDKMVPSEMKLKYPKGFRCSIFLCQLIDYFACFFALKSFQTYRQAARVAK